MNIVAINSSGRHKGTITALTEAALEGAATAGAQTDMIMLRDRNIHWCNNCLKCYNDLTSDLAPCSVNDDMTGILEQVTAADGVLFASPVHNGHLTAPMVLFFERMVWRVCKPTGSLAGLKGIPEPRTNKIRVVGAIASAGGMPDKLRKFCDGTPFIKDNGCLFLNGHWVGDLYAGAHLKKKPESPDDWHRLYHLKQLSRTQLDAARDLGRNMAETISKGGMKVTKNMGPLALAAAGLMVRFMGEYKIVDQVDA